MAKVDKMLKEADREWDNLGLPEFAAIDPRDYEYEGDVNYAPIDALLAGDSEMKGIETDPRLKDHQMAALSSLTDLVDGGGMTAQDEANLARIQSESAQADKGRRDAILQNMQARGLGGSGMELLSQLQSSQAATDRHAQQGLDVAGMAQQRALQAMMNRGQMSGQMQAQDFGQQAQIAAAQDAINRFNTSNQNQFAMNNANMGYGAAVDNRNARQGIANANVGASNEAQMHNTFNIPQAQFGAATEKLKGQQSLLGAQIARENAKEAAKKSKVQAFTGLAGAAVGSMGGPAGAAAGAQAGGMIGGYGYDAMSDEREKKDVSDVKDVDIEEFLESFSPKNFKYKDPSNGEGRRAGFMAQDIKDTKLGQEVVAEGEDGKLRYDPVKLQGVQMAAIKFLADKIKEK